MSQHKPYIVITARPPEHLILVTYHPVHIIVGTVFKIFIAYSEYAFIIVQTFNIKIGYLIGRLNNTLLSADTVELSFTNVAVIFHRSFCKRKNFNGHSSGISSNRNVNLWQIRLHGHHVSGHIKIRRLVIRSVGRSDRILTVHGCDTGNIVCSCSECSCRSNTYNLIKV